MKTRLTAIHTAAMKNLFWLLIGALITLIVPNVFGDTIHEAFRADRLVGTMQIALWQPEAQQIQPSPQQNSADLLLTAINEKKSFARLTLKNNSDAVVQNIKIKFDPYTSDVLPDKAVDPKNALQKNVDEINIPEMKQGEEQDFSIWSNSDDPSIFQSAVQTYSSTGPVRMSYVFQDTSVESGETGLEGFVDNVLPWIGAGVLVLLAIVGISMSVHNETLIKGILKDQRLYDVEKQKYDADPAKYTPATSSTKPPP